MTFQQRLERATKNSQLCVGLDPVPERLPVEFRGRPDGVARFLRGIVEATAHYAAAFKPNLAFFEALGKPGDKALFSTIEAVRDFAPGALLIGDGKRGDIGSTAERYAVALFDRWGFDAVTVNPWFGEDGVKPFAEREEKGVYLLAATSNPSSAELQEVGDPSQHLHLRVAELASEKWNANKNLGLVVGATRTETMTAMRESGPGLPWLIPGVGAQGGDLQAAVQYGCGVSGEIPSVVNASRSVLYASAGADYALAASKEAKKLRDQIREAKKAVADA